MDIEEWKYILQDVRSQLHQQVAMQQLLKLTQKSTKKLQCHNLYSQLQRRSYDLQIQQQKMSSQISQLYLTIHNLHQTSPSQHLLQLITQRLEQIKIKYIQTFDILNKQQEILNVELVGVQKYLGEIEKEKEIGKNRIQEQDQYDDQFQNQNDQNNQYKYNQPSDSHHQHNSQTHIDRINKLNQQITDILTSISKINYGKGKWLDTDHKDFIKIYNKAQGNDKKIINEGIKILGMKQTQITDHLQLYQNYLQLQKQKKLATQQYKQIKFFMQEQNRQKQQQKQQIKRLQKVLKSNKQSQQRQLKRQQIQQFKRKKAQQKQKMILKQQQQDRNKFKIPPIPTNKKKQIIQRNRLAIENQQKKIIQARNKQSIQKKITSSKNVKISSSLSKTASNIKK